MSEISNNQLYGVLLDIKEDIGTLNAKSDGTAAQLVLHEARVTALEAGANRQRGAGKVVTLLAGALGTVGGLLVTWFTKGGH